MANIRSTVHTQNGATTLGTSTAKTLLGGAAVILPAWTKDIEAVIPTATLVTPTAAESLIAQCDVESNDISIMPFQCLCAPTCGGLSTIIHTFQAKPEKYAMNVPVNGGEQINIYETPLVANTAAPFGGATLVIGNYAPAGVQRHAKMGTLTSTGTTANSDVAGTRYNFSGASHLVELQAAVVGTTLASVKPFQGYIKYTSAEFAGVADVKLPLTPISPVLTGTTGGVFIDGVSRLPVDIPLNLGQGQVNVQDYGYFGLISSSAGNFVSGVIYE